MFPFRAIKNDSTAPDLLACIATQSSHVDLTGKTVQTMRELNMHDNAPVGVQMDIFASPLFTPYGQAVQMADLVEFTDGPGSWWDVHQRTLENYAGGKGRTRALRRDFVCWADVSSCCGCPGVCED